MRKAVEEAMQIWIDHSIPTEANKADANHDEH